MSSTVSFFYAPFRAYNKTIPGPEKRKVPYMIGTPLAKRELEHRISVGNILRDLNLAKYIGIFNDEEINFEVFLTLSEKDLHDIGIDCQRDIELILGKVAEYNAGLWTCDYWVCVRMCGRNFKDWP